MTIVSISLNNKILEEIDKIKFEYGYSGRSEVIRAGARLLISENKENEKIKGHINSILLVIHNQNVENVVSDIKHKYESVVKTQIHSHLKENKCLEIFILDGDSDIIKLLFRNFKICGKMDYVKLITA